MRVDGAGAHAPSGIPPVGGQAVRGAFWNLLFAVSTKAVTFGAQFALAWLLIPEEMGLAAMALSVTSLASIMTSSGLRDVLLQRQDRFASESGQAFWLSLALNGVAGILVIALAPLAGAIFRDERVVPLVRIVGAAWPIQALPTVYAAALLKNLRFRSLAAIHFMSGGVQAAGSILLAALGFGSFALVVPFLLSATLAAAAQRVAAGPIRLGVPVPRLWPALLAPALWLMLQGYLLAVQAYGAHFIIGLFRAPAEVGLFFWGFSISSQAVFLMAANLRNIFFPTLAKLNAETARQYRGFRSAVLVMTVSVIPVCVIQMLAARPLLALLFPERWLPAAPVIFWLSVGMMTQPVNVLSTSLMMARGRNKLVALTAGVQAVVVLVCAAAGAWRGGVAEIALLTGLGLFFSNLATGWCALRELGEDGLRLAGLIARPLAIAAACVLAGRWALVAARDFGPLPELVAVIVSVGVLFALLLYALMPKVPREMTERIKGLFAEAGS